MSNKTRTINITVSENIERNPRTASFEDRAYIGKYRARMEKNPRNDRLSMSRSRLRSRPFTDEPWNAPPRRGNQTKGSSATSTEVDRLLAQRYGQLRLVPSKTSPFRSPYDLRYTSSNLSNQCRIMKTSAKDPRFRRTIRVMDTCEDNEETHPSCEALNYDDRPVKNDSAKTVRALPNKANESGDGFDSRESSTMSVAVQTQHWQPRGRAESTNTETTGRPAKNDSEQKVIALPNKANESGDGLDSRESSNTSVAVQTQYLQPRGRTESTNTETTGRCMKLKRSSSDVCQQNKRQYRGSRHRSEGRKSDRSLSREQISALNQNNKTKSLKQAPSKASLETERVVTAKELPRFVEESTQNKMVKETMECEQYWACDKKQEMAERISGSSLRVSHHSNNMSKTMLLEKYKENTSKKQEMVERISGSSSRVSHHSNNMSKTMLLEKHKETISKKQEMAERISGSSTRVSHHFKNMSVSPSSTMSVPPVLNKLSLPIYSHYCLNSTMSAVLVLLVLVSLAWFLFIGYDSFSKWRYPPNNGWTDSCKWFLHWALRRMTILERQCNCT